MRNVESRLAHLDELGIDVQVLFPSMFLVRRTSDAAEERALYRSYNRWLGAVWQESKGRLIWTALIPLLSFDGMVSEFEYAKEHGACAVFFRPFECDRHIHDEYFYPLYETAMRFDFPIAIHAGVGGVERSRMLAGHNFSFFKLSIIATFHELIESRLPQCFPALRWAILEAGCQWLPYAIADLRKRLKRRQRPLSDRPLHDHNVYVACEVTEDIPYVITQVGDDNLVLGTDYGHRDTSAELMAFGALRDSGLGQSIIDKIVGSNPQSLYGLSDSE